MLLYIIYDKIKILKIRLLWRENYVFHRDIWNRQWSERNKNIK